jgi:hypothetical protein
MGEEVCPEERKGGEMKKKLEHKKSCSPKCWYAKRDKCTCICNGANHKLEERASKTLLKDMEKNYKEYKRLRRKQRKQLRAGLTTKSGSPSFIYKVRKAN